MFNDHKNFKEIKISLASPEDIRSWSYGEVTKPETINYKSLKPEKDGLFDQRIFGPIKNYECECGKYKKENNRGKICERCGVQLTESIVRRKRMGHIELEDPVSHIWMLKASPSQIALALNMRTKDLEEVIYFVSYIVLDAGDAKNLRNKMVLDLGNAKTSQETRERLIKTLENIKKDLTVESIAFERAQGMIEDLKTTNIPFSMDECAQFINKYTNAKFGIGAEAIEHLLKNLDLKEEIKKIKRKIQGKKSQTDKLKLMRSLKTLNDFLRSGNKPEWMILHAIPVLPPDIRPIIQLDGGRFTASELNDLYRKIIIRNERLKRVKQMGAPSIIINNEKRMLQEAVDALIDNDRKARPVTGRDKRPLKSLTAILKGKQGRFRQNLLGKRVDYSGRSVIAVGPELKMYQCGLPRDMAIVLFKPFIIAELLRDAKESNSNLTYKMAEKMIDQRDERVWDFLEVVIKERPVLLNRAPTLHRLGIQAFEPKLVKGKAIRLHPLVTPAFNADFDGDQMAVHVPITPEAVAEARYLMLGSKNILGPKDGKPIVTPTQDMVLGNYYLTFESKGKIGEGNIYRNFDDAVLAYDNKQLHLHAIIAILVNAMDDKIKVNDSKNKVLITTVGKLIFNKIFPVDFPYFNEPTAENLDYLDDRHIILITEDIRKFIASREAISPFKKSSLSNIITKFFKKYGTQKTAEMLDNMKNLGFKFSTISGITISAQDMKAYEGKKEYFIEADKYIAEVQEFYRLGMMTEREKHKLIVEKWSDVKDLIQKKLEIVLKQDINNPITIMTDSGARSNLSNFTQLVGMRGLMNNPKGEVIELPIRSSFIQGITVLEFYITTHGARKGMADMALKTADSGYLTRRLVDVAQEIIIVIEDCQTEKGFLIKDIVDTKNYIIIVPLQDRAFGRFTKSAIINKNGKEIVPANTLITEDINNKIAKNNIMEFEIRSVLTCDASKGVCKKCYGLNLATGAIVDIGETVGIVAAQSIGEPGTQLTMRTFHTGGVAGGLDITQGLPRIKELLDNTIPKGAVAIISEIDGTVQEINEENGINIITVVSEHNERKYKTPYNSNIRVKVGSLVKAGQKLTEGAINVKHLLEIAGIKEVQEYILKEVQKVYRLQGIQISDKYIEIIIKQMLNKIQIIDGGDSHLLVGETVTIKEFKDIVGKLLSEDRHPPYGFPIMFGIKKAPLESNSFLSAASFQDTTRVLTKAIIKGKIDTLEGLKENVILGNLIPAGTGLLDSEDIIARGKIAYEEEY